MSDWQQPITMGQLLDQTAERFGDREAFLFGEQRLTWAQVHDKANALAAGLMEIGVGTGDKVSLWLPNSLEWIYAFFALAKLGAVLIPVNTRFKTGDAEYVIRQSDSKVLITTERFGASEFLTSVHELCPGLHDSQPGAVSSERLPALRSVILVSEERHAGTYCFADILTAGERGGCAHVQTVQNRVNPLDPFLIVYTSGTTGFPKGAVHSHKVIRNMADAARRMGLTEADRLVLYMPLFHVFGSMAGVIVFTIAGGSIVLMQVFDAGESLRLMAEERATVAYGVDTMFYDQMQHPDFPRYDFSRIRTGLCPSNPEFVAKCRQVFCKVNNVYGMTETTSITSLPFAGDAEEKAVGTVGYPLDGFSARVIDPRTGAALPPGEQGELVVRGHPVMLEYYKKPEETRTAVDPEGWFHTGDLATLTPDGYIRIMGRIKDLIRCGGENLDPVEIEILLNRLPGVGMSQVIGVKDERRGEVPLAFIQTLPGHEPPSLETVVTYLQPLVASFKIPRYVEHIAEWPKTPTGKIQKFRLRELAESRLGLQLD